MKWRRFGIGVVTAPLSGAFLAFALTLIGRSPRMIWEQGQVYDQIGIAVVGLLLVYVFLVIGVAVVGVFLVAFDARRIWIGPAIGLAVGLPFGYLAQSPGNSPLENSVVLAGPPLIAVATAFFFWRIALRPRPGLRR